ncbi:protein PERCC1 [Phyllopteryx taeniolatus]|uniref:protein PERCC1 n=1 Tax=Phyllopteryx taeniolatus TaxID=161469 RepID=UPI002AD31E11|nr:protein PERCC1 [Phyllopteryx taeniolatus]
MTTGVMRNLLLRAPSPAYFPPEEDEEDEEDDKGSTDDDEEDECPDPRPSDPQDVTERLLRFADIISRDVRRYFGRREARDVYEESAGPVGPTGGRLRYDDLLRLAGSAAEGPPSSELGPLAELFESRGKGQVRPMNARHLPLSFWMEPDPPNPQDGHAPPRDTHANYSLHTLENSQPDFSDLLANWDPNPDDADVLQ